MVCYEFQKSGTQWQIVFAIGAAIYVIGNLLYCTLGSTKTQPWDAAGFLRLPHNSDDVSCIEKSESLLPKKDLTLEIKEAKVNLPNCI